MDISPGSYTTSHAPYPQNLVVGCSPEDGTDREKKSDGTLSGSLLAGNEYEAICLIQSGVDVNEEKKGTPPLHIAVGCTTSAVVKILLDHGANIHAENKYGETALHIAARMGHLDVLRLLLHEGVHINLQSSGRDSSVQPTYIGNQGWSALHEAADRGDDTIIRALLAYGADRDAKTSLGKSPLAIAVESGHHKATMLLRDPQFPPGFPLTPGNMPSTAIGNQSHLLAHLETMVGQGGSPPVLCSICTQLKQASNQEVARSSCHCVQYPSVLSIRESAASGCPLCRLLLDRISRHPSKNLETTGIYIRSGTTWHKPISGGIGGLFGALMGKEARGEDIRHSIQIILDPRANEEVDWIEVLRLSSTTGMGPHSRTTMPVTDEERR